MASTSNQMDPAPHEGGDETVDADKLRLSQIADRYLQRGLVLREDLDWAIAIANAAHRRADAAEQRAASAEAEVVRLQGLLAEKNELNRRLMEALSYEGKAVVVMRAIFGDNPIERPSIEAPDDAAGSEA